jgi:hypothetical protein
VNYALKGSFLIALLETVPELAAAMKDLPGKERKFEEISSQAVEAAALILVY